MNKLETAGVIAPPPLIYFAGIVIGLVLRNPASTPLLPRGLGYRVGAALILSAALVSL